MVRGLAALILWIFCLAPVGATADASNEGTRSLAPALQSLIVAMDAARFSNSLLVPQLTNLLERFVTLEQNLNRLAKVPEEYDASFEIYASLLASAVVDEATVRLIAADVEVKNRFL